MDILRERRLNFERRKPHIVSLIGLRELERFVQTGLIGRMDVAPGVRRARVQAARQEVQRIAELMEKSLMLVTALAPHIGYDRAAQIAKKASTDGLTLRQAALQSGFVDEQQFDQWIVPIDMTHPDPV